MNEDLEEDIPFPENWERYDLDTLKQHISDWLDWNIEHEYTKDPQFYMSNSVNEKRFYFRVVEEDQAYSDITSFGDEPQ